MVNPLAALPLILKAQQQERLQAVVLEEFDGLHTHNPNGDLPIINDDPTQPNEAYFKHVDYIIDKAAEYNLVIGLPPT